MSTQAVGEIAPVLREIPLDQIKPSPFNRKTFDQKKLDELAASINSTNGVIEPIVLRPVEGSVPYELVAGERRWLASKKAGRKTITSSVRKITQAEALEVMIQENAHGEDVHPLELCRTYKALLKETDSKTGKPYTRELIAERVGKSYSLVCGILQTDQLIPEIQKACQEGKINGSIAIEISKYQPKEQERIFVECFNAGFDYDEYREVKDIAKDKEAEASISVRQVRAWIQEKVHIDLSKAPFDTKDEHLLKGATSCVKCPKRTGSNPGLFDGDVKRGDVCTDPGCYEAKKEALVQIKIAEAQRQAKPAEPAKPSGELVKLENQLSDKRFLQNAPPATVTKVKEKVAKLKAKEAEKPAKTAAKELPVQKISELEYWVHRDERKKDVLYGEGDEYQLATPKCKLTQKAVYADGKKFGKIVDICVEDNCQAHGYSSSYSGGSSGSRGGSLSLEEKRKRLKQQRDNKLDQAYRTAATAALRASVKELKVDDLRDIALEMANLMDRRYRNPIFAAMGWKTSDNSYYGPSIPEKQILSLKPADLAAFLGLITVASHVLPGSESYWGRSNVALGPFVKRHKINLEKIKAEAEAPLRKKFAEIDARKKAAAPKPSKKDKKAKK